MADLLSCLLSLPFGLADAAASPSSFVALVPGYGAGAPDAADVDGYVMPKAGAIVGVTLLGKPTQAGDFQMLQVYKNGSAVTGTQVFNAYNAGAEAGASLILSKDTSALQFVAGDIIQLRYETGTSGVYGARDIAGTVIVQLGLSE